MCKTRGYYKRLSKRAREKARRLKTKLRAMERKTKTKRTKAKCQTLNLKVEYYSALMSAAREAARTKRFVEPPKTWKKEYIAQQEYLAAQAEADRRWQEKKAMEEAAERIELAAAQREGKHCFLVHYYEEVQETVFKYETDEDGHSELVSDIEYKDVYDTKKIYAYTDTEAIKIFDERYNKYYGRTSHGERWLYYTTEVEKLW